MAHLNSHKNILNVLGAIENKFPVDKWEVNKVHVWPYIRIKLYYHLLNVNTFKDPEETKEFEELKKEPFFLKLKNVIKSYFNTLKFYNSLQSKKVIFVGSHFHRVLQDGVYFNRFFDPLIEKYNLKDEVYTFEFQKFFSNSFNKKAVFHLAEVLRNYKVSNKLISKLDKKKDDVNLSLYKEFQEFLNDELKELPTFCISENDLKKWTKKINSLTPFFEKVLKKVKPNKIVFLSYYGFDDNYAFILTANKMKIKAVDFQHGPQTNVHMAYSNWNKMPKDGFNIMPKEYWNWDVNSKENIDAWAKNTNIKTKVIGNPYIEYCLKQNKAKSSKKQILLSLQTSPLDLLTNEVISLIANSTSHWVLRLHPRNKTSITKIEDFLIKNNINTNTEIQTADEIPLPNVLLNSILHITNYSGCVLEALVLNVPTVIIHNVGLEMFKGYIDDEKVYYINKKSVDFDTRINEILSLQSEVSKALSIVNNFNPID